jgi:hypothetical protein
MVLIRALACDEGFHGLEAVDQTVLHEEIEAAIDVGGGDGGILRSQHVA